MNTTPKITNQENGNNPAAVIKVNLVALIPKIRVTNIKAVHVEPK